MFENESETEFKKRLQLAKNTRIKKLYIGNMESIFM